MTALRKGWTPELIEGRLKVEWPDDPRMRISHECLYRWIYAKPQRALGLRRYLPRSKRHRTRSKGRRARGPRIPMRVPITDRPKKVDSRHLQARGELKQELKRAMRQGRTARRPDRKSVV